MESHLGGSPFYYYDIIRHLFELCLDTMEVDMIHLGATCRTLHHLYRESRVRVVDRAKARDTSHLSDDELMMGVMSSMGIDALPYYFDLRHRCRPHPSRYIISRLRAKFKDPGINGVKDGSRDLISHMEGPRVDVVDVPAIPLEECIEMLEGLDTIGTTYRRRCVATGTRSIDRIASTHKVRGDTSGTRSIISKIDLDLEESFGYHVRGMDDPNTLRGILHLVQRYVDDLEEVLQVHIRCNHIKVVEVLLTIIEPGAIPFIPSLEMLGVLQAHKGSDVLGGVIHVGTYLLSPHPYRYLDELLRDA